MSKQNNAQGGLVVNISSYAGIYYGVCVWVRGWVCVVCVCV